MALRSNIPSAPGQSVVAGVTATAGEINYNDISAVGTVEASKAVVVDGSKDIGTFGVVSLGSLTMTQTARTATAAGDGTGLIADAGLHQMIAVTSAGANNIITLPTPTPGTVVELYVGANGYELRSSAPGTVLIGAGAGGAAVESAIPANSVARLFCVDATHWVGYTITAATLAAVEAAAA